MGKMSKNKTWRSVLPEKDLFIRKQKQGKDEEDENVEKHFFKFFKKTILSKLEIASVVWCRGPPTSTSTWQMRSYHRDAILRKPLFDKPISMSADDIATP